MRIIIIENEVFKVSEKIFKQIEKKKKEIYSKPYYTRQEMDTNDFLESIRPSFKFIDVVHFDFRL
jgi:hypothetical protein